MARIQKILAIASLSMLGFLMLNILSPWGIRINLTDSLPFTFFISSLAKTNDLEIGSYVSLCHPSSSRPLAKQIIGIPGDRICVSGECVCLNGVCVGTVQCRSPSGLLLTAIGEGTIPEGYVFVFAPHESSFDSRYAEFGLIEQNSIKELLWPIF